MVSKIKFGNGYGRENDRKKGFQVSDVRNTEVRDENILTLNNHPFYLENNWENLCT